MAGCSQVSVGRWMSQGGWWMAVHARLSLSLIICKLCAAPLPCRRHEAATRRWQKQQAALRELQAAQQAAQERLAAVQAAVAEAAIAEAADCEAGGREEQTDSAEQPQAASEAADAASSSDDEEEERPARRRRVPGSSTTPARAATAAGLAPEAAASSRKAAASQQSGRSKRQLVVSSDSEGEAGSAPRQTPAPASSAGGTSGKRAAAGASSAARPPRSRRQAHSPSSGGESDSDFEAQPAASRRVSRAGGVARAKRSGRQAAAARGAAEWGQDQVAAAWEELEQGEQQLQVPGRNGAALAHGAWTHADAAADLPAHSKHPQALRGSISEAALAEDAVAAARLEAAGQGLDRLAASLAALEQRQAGLQARVPAGAWVAKGSPPHLPPLAGSLSSIPVLLRSPVRPLRRLDWVTRHHPAGGALPPLPRRPAGGQRAAERRVRAPHRRPRRCLLQARAPSLGLGRWAG